MLGDFFQTTALPSNQMFGVYDFSLVTLSYIVAAAASYIALDIVGVLRELSNTALSALLWIVFGAIAMGSGIWSMHFIGMLAFIMPMPMHYDFLWTTLSLIIAIVASGFALYLLRERNSRVLYLILGGIVLGLAIASMHYTGMAAMLSSVEIRYLPGLFVLSIVIAILASEAAIWLALKSNEVQVKHRISLKIVSALIMGAAICGMHYTAMAAAVFTPYTHMVSSFANLDINFLSILIAVVTFFILTIAFMASTYKVMNSQNIYAARQAGMAQVAANVLHNVGNVLNSINTSATMVKENIDNSELINLKNIVLLLNEHKPNLGKYLTEDPKGRLIPEYIRLLDESWYKEKNQISTELRKLTENIEHIKKVLLVQQALSKVAAYKELTSIRRAIEESIFISGADSRHLNIQIELKVQKIPNIMLDKVKLIQILINLIQNAKDSVLESPVKEKKIIISSYVKNDHLFITVEDNGIGIPEKNLTQIFSHGFTTKKKGHGFGLHACALSVREMGGDLKAQSKGLGKGAVFILELPYEQGL